MNALFANPTSLRRTRARRKSSTKAPAVTQTLTLWNRLDPARRQQLAELLRRIYPTMEA